MMKRYITILAIAGLALGLAAQDTDEAIKEQRAIEREAYHEARRLNTVEGWEIFINNYPDSYFIEQACKMRDAAVVNSYCNSATTLEQLNTYIEQPGAKEPRIRTFYANLVNNPTHSYRYEHMDVGFNGCTGRVDEHIVFHDGSPARDNFFIFDDKGLLVTSSIQGTRSRPVVINYSYDYDKLYGYRLRSASKDGGLTHLYEAFYDDNDKLEILASDNKSKWVYTYNDNGALSKLVVTDGNTVRTLVYNGGYIIREEVGRKVLRYLYDYDTATKKKYLIAINELNGQEVVHERKLDYSIDTHGRVTRVDLTLDAVPLMTITRTYSE